MTDERAEIDIVALTATVTERFTELFDGGEEFLGPLGQRRVRSVLTSVSLRGYRKMEELTSLPVLADLAGRPDVFLGCVEALRLMPWTGDYSVYEPVRQLFCGAMRRAELEGTDPAPYRSMISLPELGHPGEPVRNQNIKSRAAGMVWKRMVASSATNEKTGTYGLAITCLHVRVLYLAWAFGGSLFFTRAKIDGHIEAATTLLRELRAIR